MKKNLYLSVCLLLTLMMSMAPRANAQFSSTFKPGPAVGEDVSIITSYGCTPSNASAPLETYNFDGYELAYTEWTIYALNCSYMTSKALIRFTEMNTLPCNANITYAELRFYGVPSSGMAPQGNSTYPGSPYGTTNPGYVSRVTSGWTETGVTYSSIPSITTVNQASIVPSTSQWNWNTTVNVTGITNDIWTSGINDGYMLTLQTPVNYRNVLFASSDDGNNALWPELYVEYSVPCNANFTYCSSTTNPNTYHFDAVDPSSCLTYHWDFGDGNVGFGPNVTHTYWAPGTYTICMYLEDRQTGKVYCKECTTICINEIVKGNGDDPKEMPAQNGAEQMMKPVAPHFNTTSNAATSAPKGIKMVFTDASLTVISLSPNPAQSVVNVNFRLINNSRVSYKVYDISGKLVAGDAQEMGKGAQKLTIPVEKLSSGVYMIEMEDGYTHVKQKFTKE